jgi:hypothetical protein
MMHGAVGLGAYLAKFPLVDAFRHDGFGGVLARLELRSRGLFFGLGFLWPDFGVLVAWECDTSLLLLTIGRTDLHEFRFRSDGLRDMGIDLALIAGRVGALCGIRTTGKYFPLARHPRSSHKGVELTAILFRWRSSRMEH